MDYNVKDNFGAAKAVATTNDEGFKFLLDVSKSMGERFTPIERIKVLALLRKAIIEDTECLLKEIDCKITDLHKQRDSLIEAYKSL